MRAMLTSFVCAVSCVVLIAGAQSPTAVRYRVTNPLTLQTFCYCSYYPGEINIHGDVAGAIVYWDAGYHLYFDSPDESQTRVFAQSSGPVAGLNGHGEITGTFFWPEEFSFIWSARGGFERIPVLFDLVEACYAVGINDNRQVIGHACLPETGQRIAFRWDSIAGDAIDLGHLPGGEFTARPIAINRRGDVVGTCVSRPPDGPAVQEAFFWSEDGGMQSLGRWINGAVPLSAASINDAGRVVGFVVEPGFGIRPYIWDAGSGFAELNVLPGPDPFVSVSPADINNSDTVVGAGRVSNGDVRAFVWSAQRGMRSLEILLDPCDRHVRELTETGGINDLGVIVVHDERVFEGSTSVVLLTPYLVGDLDGDDTVGLGDLAILLSNFGLGAGALFGDGDGDCDGDVDLQDLATVLAYFGETLP